jgi:hypothetical protein
VYQRFNLILLTAVCSLVACDPVTAPADTNAAPAPACPPPNLSQKDWRTVSNIRVGISLRVPKKYNEKHWAVTVGDFIGATFRAGHFEDLSFTVEAPEDRSLEQHKINRQRDYEGYSECTEMISGHQAIIQSFRGGGVIFDVGRSYPPYAIAGVCELRPGRILAFHGTASSRQAQEEQLAIIRTLEFIR